ncbi:DUF1934 domain-containing protein [Bacillus niameyensis]|uniref:DUF1934 domain-containing protein n=1 Tax=Bacillus niameyensis TaxID=1522308 RepID=UPI0008411912|nr:DUF1934 domain-containing protein [Bacillus niameyensis]
MKTPVKIHLTTTVKIDEEEETYELTVFGHHYKKGNTIYLKYDEVQKGGTIHTVVKMVEDEATILRSGLLKMRLSFRLFEERNGSHESEFGNLFITTNTKKLVHHYENDKCAGELNLAYDLAMQGTHAGIYKMDIVYKEMN